ncbi:DNA repair protein [Duganella sp. Leaf126]|uniref:DNA-3-methyladenine glycosylase 2 n=1 Tax=Duganella sp. Leaf126 TaxID=1736266 RepID=UPI000701BDE8|nr:DNA-3-methyladenine glycosylase [Duganella sp. Leaf126]KQQ33491.1 DNA repair protein [Duganella sp. Leaf126]
MAAASTFDLAFELAPGYRLQDVLAFHRRDTQALAEQVDEHMGQPRLRKGVVLGGVPVLLEILFELAVEDRRDDGETAVWGVPRTAAGRALCTVHADGKLSGSARSRLQAQAYDAVRNILGLRLDPAPFCALAADDPLLGPLVRAQPGLLIVQSATVFEALTWAVIGQQINLSFAIALRRTLIALAGRRHSSGLWCYPGPADVAAVDCAQLQANKFSRAKADTLLRLAQLVDSGALDLQVSPTNSIAQISAALLAVKGIGPWTVNYALLRGYGYADCSLHGDVAIRAALQALLQEDVKPDLARTEQLLARYAPHRTMAAAHLWASLAHLKEP